MNAIANLLFPSSSSRRPDVTTILGFTQPGIPHPWAEKAVLCLVKKLEKEEGAVDNLKEVLQSPDGSPEKNKCIVIKRSTDGRLQVAGKKNFPHVVFCKLWRWSDLQSQYELKPVKDCQFTFSKKTDKVCVNPWHYDRILASPLPSPIRQEPQQLQVDVDIQQSESWGKIVYYELNNRVGEPYICRGATITVDGYVNPDPNLDRFSLGLLTGMNLYTNASIASTRRNIGDGIKLTHFEGEVYLENLSNYAVFVQSWIGNYIDGNYPNCVVRVGPGATVKAFCTQTFRDVVVERTHSQGYDALHKLIDQSIIRISFVKGFGRNYNRIEITHTPCWMELSLFTPLKILDQALKTFKPPGGCNSSHS